MRLLNTDTLEINDFDHDHVPQYAILSHRWGKEELTLQDMEEGVTTKAGFKKVQECCSRAKKDGFDYVWIDTCCINKTSSAELSEAINSMYLWYFQADRCYAYLADVPSKSSLEESEWFARGWTLQELLAPSDVYFVDENWDDLGTKKSMPQTISGCTGIPADILTGDHDIESASIAQRMSWAAKRKTQRPEDRAYCLMGIFGINMPLLYGEGERAFFRLQEEIMKISDDHSLFAWESADARGGLLATSPEAFKNSGDVVQFNYLNDPEDVITRSSRGIDISLRLVGKGPRGLGLAILHCKRQNGKNKPIAIYVRDLFWTMKTFERVMSNKLEQLDLGKLGPARYPIRRMCIQMGRLMPTRRSKCAGRTDTSMQYEIYDEEKLGKLMGTKDLGVLIYAAGPDFEDRLWLRMTQDGVGSDNIDQRHAYMFNALRSVIANSHETAVKILLAQTGKINANELGGLLIEAALRGHVGILKLLLDSGAEIGWNSHYVQGIFFTAIDKGYGDIVKLLLDRGTVLTVDEYHTSIHISLIERHVNVLKVLLDTSDSCDCKDEVLLAVSEDRYEDAKKLLDEWSRAVLEKRKKAP